MWSADTVAKIDTGAATFELQGVNATGYGTFTSGTLRMKSGPGTLRGDVKSQHAPHGYILTYGAPSIR